MAFLPIFAAIAVALLAPASQAKSVVCYFPNWATYHTDVGKYTVNDIDPNLCTQLVYAFASLDATSLEMVAFDPWMDVTQGTYVAFNNLRQKNPNLKTLLAIGGWTDSQAGDKYSRLVQNPSARANFIAKAVPFLQQYNFQGLDIDWEYPKTPADKAGFSAFVKELKTAFQPLGFMLTAAVSGSAPAIDAGYDVPVVSQYLDEIHLMSYDYHGLWEQQANYVADLYPDVNYAATYWMQKGCPASKLILGLPTYGISWTLTSSQVTPPAPASGGGPGPYVAGNMPYWYICQKIQNEGWTEVVDVRAEAYAYKLPSWVSYDDPTVAKAKGQYAASQNLGGIMFWDISTDDFRNLCQKGNYPLVSAARKAFCGSATGSC